MYQKYNTAALVLSDREFGEADRVFTLYTRDFGLVRARASAVRKESSRMRYALQRFCHVEVSLVRGLRGWRLAGASLLRGMVGNREALAAFARLAALAERLIAGEEKNTYLFDTLADAHRTLVEEYAPVPSVELITVARLLYVLGYLSHEATEAVLFAHTTYEAEEVQLAEARREALLASVNRAIAATQL